MAEVRNLATTIFRFLPEAEGRYMVLSGISIIVIVVLMAVFSPFISPYNPIKSSGDVLQPPSPKHIMGTDNLGRDVFPELFLVQGLFWL